MEEYASGAAYEGRAALGNTQPGDGPRYKGRGIIQLTGRLNYRVYGAALGLDLENNPQLAAVPENAVRIACEYWRRNNLNQLADADNLEAITRRINGGVNGLADRRIKLGIA
jgi:putative chitinase